MCCERCNARSPCISEMVCSSVLLPVWLLVSTALLYLPHCSTSDSQWVAVSSYIEVCGFTCNEFGVYQLDRSPPAPILELVCPDKSARPHVRIYNPYTERVFVNETSGCCLIRNAQRSDTGDYVLEWTGKNKWIRTAKCQVIDPVCVTNISARHNGENVSVSVSYSGEEATVVWAWNGGALPERHQLSDSNKTLTVPSTDTGTFTALVSNPVSHSSAHYNLTLPGTETDMSSQPVQRSRIPIIALVSFLCVFTGFSFCLLMGNPIHNLAGCISNILQ
ncbi:hypothetical protein XENTR_v10022353 [Xenopus tropicalis]|nr:hypothetical protein XENTR_v10022353 [Xenopus tropicalis]